MFMNEQVNPICVVHLVRYHNGIEPFRRFLESYRKNPGGIDHNLLIIFKGFNNPADIEEYECLLDHLQYSKLELSDEGFDITAYFSAINNYSDKYRYFCFLNSYSVILDHDWLYKLYSYIIRPDVGIAGATGSWRSHRGVMPFWWLPVEVVIEIYRACLDGEGITSLFQKGISSIKHNIYLLSFDTAPNFHLRTNAFMISGALMQQFKCLSIKTKTDAYKFESGKKGLSKQIIKMGKKIIVVGCDGNGYEKKEWGISNTFHQSDQENLLVADNQTREYQEGNNEKRQYLSFVSWKNCFFIERLKKRLSK